MFVITDIGRDGMLEGPDIDGLTVSAELAGAPVIASGGVSSLADIEALADIPGLGGVITGKAVYEGRFTVDEALSVVTRRAAREPSVDVPDDGDPTAIPTAIPTASPTGASPTSSGLTETIRPR